MGSSRQAWAGAALGFAAVVLFAFRDGGYDDPVSWRAATVALSRRRGSQPWCGRRPGRRAWPCSCCSGSRRSPAGRRCRRSGPPIRMRRSSRRSAPSSTWPSSRPRSPSEGWLLAGTVGGIAFVCAYAVGDRIVHGTPEFDPFEGTPPARAARLRERARRARCDRARGRRRARAPAAVAAAGPRACRPLPRHARPHRQSRRLVRRARRLHGRAHARARPPTAGRSDGRERRAPRTRPRPSRGLARGRGGEARRRPRLVLARGLAGSGGDAARGSGSGHLRADVARAAADRRVRSRRAQPLPRDADGARSHRARAARARARPAALRCVQGDERGRRRATSRSCSTPAPTGTGRCPRSRCRPSVWGRSFTQRLRNGSWVDYGPDRRTNV